MSGISESSDDRSDMYDIVLKELGFFKERMTFLMQELNSLHLKQESLLKLDSSIKLLIKIVDAYIRHDEAYLDHEDAESFGVYMNNVEEAIKAYFRSFIIEYNLQDRVENGLTYHKRITDRNGKERVVLKTVEYSDSIDDLHRLMYDSLREKRGLLKFDQNHILVYEKHLNYGYPSVIKAVKYVKNLQHHEIVHIPKDHRTNIESFGNIFTLCSTIILVFYAYIEMTGIWIDTIKRY